MENYKLTRKLYDTGSILCLAFSQDGKYIVSGCNDNTIIIWDAKKLTDHARIRTNLRGIKCLSISPNNDYIAVAGLGSNAIAVWDLNTKKIITRLNSYASSVTSISFSPDSSFLAGGGNLGNIVLWNASNFKEAAVLKAHKGSVNAITFTSDGKYLASASQDETIVLIDVNKSSPSSSKIIHNFMSKVNCEGMVIENARVSSEIKKLLIDNGAIEKSLQQPWRYR